MKKTRTRLTLKDRIVIETLLNENQSPSYIALQLGKHRCTVSREIKNWVKKPTDTYDAQLAHWCAVEVNRNKRCLDKINTYPRLKMFVYRGLINGTTPELIAGQIKIKYPKDPVMTISHEAIYQHIYRHGRSRFGKKLIKLLPYHHHKRRNKRKFPKDRSPIKNKVSIDHRPPDIDNRLEAGHLEGDLMIGIGQKSAIGTIVDRKTRAVIIVQIPNRKSKTVTKAFARLLNKQPPYLRKTMTYDNGIEMANHEWLAKNTGMDIYFAHPYSSWERGTNENTNGLIRRFLPKGTDFNNVSAKRLKQIEDNLNNRPRKVLGFRTPNEMRSQEISNNSSSVQLISEITFGSSKSQKSYSENKPNFN